MGDAGSRRIWTYASRRVEEARAAASALTASPVRFCAVPTGTGDIGLVVTAGGKDHTLVLSSWQGFCPGKKGTPGNKAMRTRGVPGTKPSFGYFVAKPHSLQQGAPPIQCSTNTTNIMRIQSGTTTAIANLKTG
jgi:hypothetical protein